MRVLGQGRGITDANLVRVLEEICQQLNLNTEGRIVAFHNAGTAAPTTGVHQQGDRIWNTAPTGSSPTLGWVCTVSGEPGTWVPWPSASGGSGDFVPFYLPAGEEFTLPENKQAEFAEAIDVEGTMNIDGHLNSVD